MSTVGDPVSGSFLLHPAFERIDGTCLSPSSARLSDRSRLAVLVQGAALVHHCERAGRPLRDWEGAVLTTAAGLRVPDPGRRHEVAAGRPAHRLVLDLLRLLFQSRDLERGRGAALGIARTLVADWDQDLVAPPTHALADVVLWRAPFLWQGRFEAARSSLVALVADGRKGPERLSVAGPAPIGRRVRRFLDDRCRSAEGDHKRAFADLVAALADADRGRALWEGVEPELEVDQLTARGRWRRAVVCAEAGAESDPVRRARLSLAVGEPERAETLLDGADGSLAEGVRAEILLRQGRLRAADRALRKFWRRDAESPIGARDLLSVGWLAAEVLAALGRSYDAEDWCEIVLQRTEASESGDAALIAEARTLAARVAWEVDDLERADALLDAAEAALGEADAEGPGIATARSRWHRTMALRAESAGDRRAALRHLARALRVIRRRASPAELGRLWNEIAFARSVAGDFVGAERALRHAIVRAPAGEGHPRSWWRNLVELRIRLGMLDGVEDVVEGWIRQDRRRSDVGRLLDDLELATRLDLCRGRWRRALSRVAEAESLVGDRGRASRLEVFALLAARAWASLGFADRARERLDAAGDELLRDGGVEELVLLRALAGDRGGARALLPETDPELRNLLAPILEGDPPSSTSWEGLRSLPDHRCIRVLLDLHQLAPDLVPRSWVRWAVALLRSQGSRRLAQRLSRERLRPWRHLEELLLHESIGSEEFRLLFSALGYPEARVEWDRDGMTEVLIDGPGGRERTRLDLGGGRVLHLRTAVEDHTARALLALMWRLWLFSFPMGEKPSRSPASSVPSAAVDSVDPSDDLVGSSEVLARAKRRADRLGGASFPVLILGETGTGKEVFARRIHRASERRRGPFLAVNCAAIDPNLVNSELFGHVRGSFTGADRDRAGFFEQASGGTAFLDEIGDLSLEVQAKLLRVLQEQEVVRIGESRPREIDVRIVTATHRDLSRMVEEGEFRRDLYFRLEVATLELPPLRERGDDSIEIARHILRLRGRKARLSQGAEVAIRTFPWPGNVRQLISRVEIAALDAGEVIEAEDLALTTDPSARGGRSIRPVGGSLREQVAELKRRLVVEALRSTGGNLTAAAPRLGVTKQALSYLVRTLDIDPDDL